MKRHRRFRLALSAVIFLILGVTPLSAGPRVDVIIGPEAAPLERLAAHELANQLQKLFEAEVNIADKLPAESPNLVLVGSPTTNPGVKKIVGARWPKLTDQGHVVRSLDKNMLLVGGGSPVATLWAVYELGHHFGMRYFLHGDVLPAVLPKIQLEGIDLVLEPIERVRAWKPFGDAVVGAQFWGLDEHRNVLRQLAKLKFNSLVMAETPAPSSALLAGRQFSVTGKIPGRSAFRGAAEFGNPELLGKLSAAERHKAAKELLRGIIDKAHDLGMDTKESADPLAEIWLSQASVLPSLGLRAVDKGLRKQSPGKTGYVCQVDVPGDVNPALHYLSRASFDAKLNPEAAYADLLDPVYSDVARARLIKGFAMIDEAALLAKESAPAVEPDMIAKIFAGGRKLPDAWKKMGTLYGGAMDEMYRGIQRSREGAGRPILLYHAKRLEFAVYYLGSLETLHLAGMEKDREKQLELLEKSLESMYNALSAQAEVARDNSDRAVIAVLNAFAYRPLKARFDEVRAAQK